MVNPKHLFELKSTPKLVLHSNSRNINDSQATTTDTTEDKNYFKGSGKKKPKKNTMKKTHSLRN